VGWRVRDVALATGLELDAGAEGAIDSWLDILAVWNARMDLTAAKTSDDIAELMLTDAFVIASRIARGASVVDVGAGAGAPGLAIALARPDLRVTLVEPLGKRVSFLRTVVGSVHRTDVSILAARGEDVTTSFDVAVSRATLEPAEWVRLAATLGRSAWVLVASRDALPAAEGMVMKETVEYELPFSKKRRLAVRYERT
jgi:16S rRNA (guanine527-N7)-methyltransferase